MGSTSKTTNTLTPYDLLQSKLRLLEKWDIEAKQDVLRCFAEFMSFEAIKEHVIKEHRAGANSILADVNVIRKLCCDVRHKYFVLQCRGKYLTKMKDIALYHKRVRLDDLQMLRDRFVSQIVALDDKNAVERGEFRFMAKGLAEVLSKAQEEVEGKGFNIQVGLGIFDMGDMDDKSDEELISRREELLKKASRALGSGGTTGRDGGGPDGVGGRGIGKSQAQFAEGDSSAGYLGRGDTTAGLIRLPPGRGAAGDNGNTADVIETQAVKSS